VPPVFGRRNAGLWPCSSSSLLVAGARLHSSLFCSPKNEAQQKIVETLVTANARAIVQSVDREIVANLTICAFFSTAPNCSMAALPSSPPC